MGDYILSIINKLIDLELSHAYFLVELAQRCCKICLACQKFYKFTVNFYLFNLKIKNKNNLNFF